MVKLKNLAPNPKNPRKISPEKLDMLKKSLSEVPGFPGYFASREGSLFSFLRPIPREMMGSPDKDGYLQTALIQNKLKKYIRKHRIIALTFLGSPPEGWVVNHKNGVKTDNHIENLEYLLPADNERHARRELGKRMVGEKASRSKLDSVTVLKIRKLQKDGLTQREIVAKIGVVSQTQVSRICRGTNWNHL